MWDAKLPLLMSNTAKNIGTTNHGQLFDAKQPLLMSNIAENIGPTIYGHLQYDILPSVRQVPMMLRNIAYPHLAVTTNLRPTHKLPRVSEAKSKLKCKHDSQPHIRSALSNATSSESSRTR